MYVEVVRFRGNFEVLPKRSYNMKLFIISLLLIAPMALFAAEQTIVLDVAGNCNSCKKTIVKAAERVDGVEEASWDKKTKKLTATFDDSKTNEDAIVKAVLAVGYDVGDKKGDDKAYSKLPDCCHYRDSDND